MSDECRSGSIIVRDHQGNLEITCAHKGGIVHQGRVIIERADMHDLYAALHEYLSGKMCLHCGNPNPRCQCWNDE